ncbi:uncharacterized protein [Parasteatoda tepidariorum]|uniref:uncharacterized protein n=1 Tax=Parasteatoda tepidariorum TaxID=114398 RepID=UPI0039BC4A1B
MCDLKSCECDFKLHLHCWKKSLFDEKNDIEGKNLFQVTPNKHKTFKEIASVENSPRSSKKSPTKVVTPRRNESSVRQKTKAGTPKTGTPSSQRKCSAKIENTVENKSSARLKLKQELANLKIAQVDSDPEDSDELSDYEDVASNGETTDDENLSNNDVINKENGELSKRRKEKLCNVIFFIYHHFLPVLMFVYLKDLLSQKIHVPELPKSR